MWILHRLAVESDGPFAGPPGNWKRWSRGPYQGQTSGPPSETQSEHTPEENTVSTVSEQGTIVGKTWMWYTKPSSVQGKWGELATRTMGFDVIAITYEELRNIQTR